VTDQQEYALAHPLTRADVDPAVLGPLTRENTTAGGNLLRILLAVDR
jgi:hypothetical protein